MPRTRVIITTIIAAIELESRSDSETRKSAFCVHSCRRHPCWFGLVDRGVGNLLVLRVEFVQEPDLHRVHEELQLERDQLESINGESHAIHEHRRHHGKHARSIHARVRHAASAVPNLREHPAIEGDSILTRRRLLISNRADARREVLGVLARIARVRDTSKPRIGQFIPCVHGREGEHGNVHAGYQSHRIEQRSEQFTWRIERRSLLDAHALRVIRILLEGHEKSILFRVLVTVVARRQEGEEVEQRQRWFD